MDLNVWFYASLGGVLPALMWLWFWLREDAKHPEPKKRIALTFIAGMLSVALVLPLQNKTYGIFGSLTANFALWALFEETLKYLACYAAALRFKDVDEPIDPLIYMITAALGFSALENTLFLIDPLTDRDIVDTIVTGNLRFVGASLLHVISSGALGVFIALSFYRSRIRKEVFVALGLSTAVALHTLFNLFIIKRNNETAFLTFGIVWIAIIILMLLFEKVKTIYPRK